MAEAPLVAEARRIVGELEFQRGNVSLVALLPAGIEDPEPFDLRPFALVIAAEWISDTGLRDLLVRVAEVINRTVDPVARLRIARLVLLPPTDPFVAETQNRYESAWRGDPIELREEFIADRPTAGGFLLSLRRWRDPGPAATEALSRPIDLAIDDLAQFDQDANLASATLSDDRVRTFTETFIADRQKSAALRSVFRWAECFERSEVPKNSAGYGFFRQLTRKGPFVSNSSWADLDPWPFAVALERHVHKLLLDHLTDAPAAAGSVPANWSSVKEALLSHAAELAPERCALFVHGAFDDTFFTDIMKDTELPERDEYSPWILGWLRGMPLVHLRTEHTQSPNAYVAALSRFAAMQQFTASPEGDDYEVIVRVLDDEEIASLGESASFLERNSLFVALPQAARSRLLRERVLLSVAEYAEIVKHDVTAAIRIPVSKRGRQ